MFTLIVSGTEQNVEPFNFVMLNAELFEKELFDPLTGVSLKVITTFT